jgi:hypothetical protein
MGPRVAVLGAKMSSLVWITLVLRTDHKNTGCIIEKTQIISFFVV